MSLINKISDNLRPEDFFERTENYKKTEDGRMAPMSGSDVGVDKQAKLTESRNNEYASLSNDTVNISDAAREMQQAAKSEPDDGDASSKKDGNGYSMLSEEDKKGNASVKSEESAGNEEDGLERIQRMLQAAQKDLQLAREDLSTAESKVSEAENPSETTAAEAEIQTAQLLVSQKNSELLALQQEMMEVMNSGTA